MKQIQISEELFSRLCAYFIMDRREPLQEQIIKDQLQEKLDRIQRRADYKKAYNRCKRAERRAADLQNILTAAERRQVEQIRQEQEREQTQFEEDEWEIE